MGMLSADEWQALALSLRVATLSVIVQCPSRWPGLAVVAAALPRAPAGRGLMFALDPATRGHGYAC